jgi:SET domain-containing protein
MKNTVVKPSPIDGKGLFALRNFAEGEIVEPIEGRIVFGTSQNKYALPIPSRHRGKQSIILTNKVRYVNGSGSPNVRFDLKKRGLVALRAIAAGEELTSKYGFV